MARITKEATTGPQKVLLAYLEKNASDELVAKINADDRTMAQCLGYCCGKARELKEGEAAVVEDGIVYGWAKHFFEETAEAIKAEKVPKVNATVKAPEKAGPVKTVKDEKPKDKKKAVPADENEQFVLVGW